MLYLFKKKQDDYLYAVGITIPGEMYKAIYNTESNVNKVLFNINYNQLEYAQFDETDLTKERSEPLKFSAVNNKPALNDVLLINYQEYYADQWSVSLIYREPGIQYLNDIIAALNDKKQIKITPKIWKKIAGIAINAMCPGIYKMLNPLLEHNLCYMDINDYCSLYMSIDLSAYNEKASMYGLHYMKNIAGELFCKVIPNMPLEDVVNNNIAPFYFKYVAMHNTKFTDIDYIIDNDASFKLLFKYFDGISKYIFDEEQYAKVYGNTIISKITFNNLYNIVDYFKQKDIDLLLYCPSGTRDILDRVELVLLLLEEKVNKLIKDPDCFTHPENEKYIRVVMEMIRNNRFTNKIQIDRLQAINSNVIQLLLLQNEK